MCRVRRRFEIYGIVIFLLDRLLKYVAVEGYSWQVAGITFHFYPNRFGMFSWRIPFIEYLAIVGLFVVAVIWWKTRSLGAWLIMLGGLSNVFDRLVFGYVVDFIRISYLPIVGGTFFNLADVMVDIGLVILLWEILCESV